MHNFTSLSLCKNPDTVTEIEAIDIPNTSQRFPLFFVVRNGGEIYTLYRFESAHRHVVNCRHHVARQVSGTVHPGQLKLCTR